MNMRPKSKIFGKSNAGPMTNRFYIQLKKSVRRTVPLRLPGQTVSAAGAGIAEESSWSLFLSDVTKARTRKARKMETFMPLYDKQWHQ